MNSELSVDRVLGITLMSSLKNKPYLFYFWSFFCFETGSHYTALAILELTVDQVAFAFQVLGLAKSCPKWGGEGAGNVTISGRTLNLAIYKLCT